MTVIPQVKCRRCGASFSALRSRCPACGTRVVTQSSRMPYTTPGTVRGTQANARANSNTKWQMIFGLTLVFAVIMSVIVMVTSSLNGIDVSTVRATATPAMLSNGGNTPVIESAPTPPPTAEPTVEQIKILYMNTKDLTPENAWPTMHVGETINVNAVVYPMDIENPVVEWSLSDTEGTTMTMARKDDGTVDLTCVGSVSGGVKLTVSCNGTSQTITIYCRD